MPSENDANLVACPSCDLLYNVGGLRDGERADCARCGDFLTRVRNDSLERVQVFSVTGLVCLAIACSFPFLSFKSKGLESVMTLPQTAGGIWDAGMPEIALVVASFMLIIPAGVMVLLLALSSCMAQARYFQWMKPLSRLLFRLQSWAMVDVFVIGVLVSLTKIAGMATVVIGISFWGYGAFAVFFVLAMSSLDTLQYWNQLERLHEASNAR